MMDLAREMELKIRLIHEGLRIDDSALTEIGQKYKESVACLFDFNINPEERRLLPQEIKLPLGTVVEVNNDARSPYLAKREDGQLILEKDGRLVTTIEWTHRPQYYAKKTSSGIPMQTVAPLSGEDALYFIYNRYCTNWDDGGQCLYCNFNYTHRQDRPKLPAAGELEEVGEIARAVLEEGIDFHLVITAGSLPPKVEIETCLNIVESVKCHTGLEKINGTTVINPPQNLSVIDCLHRAGLKLLGFNLEIWDSKMFQAICPGKSQRIGRERWLEALEYTASLFGRSYAYTSIVMGLESQETLLEGVEYLCERGIFPYVAPWMPVKGSKLEGHRAPHAEWYLEVYERLGDILARSLPEVYTAQRFFSGNGCCYRCSTVGLIWDEIRRRLVDRAVFTTIQS